MQLKQIKLILNQFWWPIKFSYQTKKLFNITEELVNYHKKNIDNIDSYSVVELYSLIGILDYAIKDLWEEEFNTVTWLDLYEDGYRILNLIKWLLFWKIEIK